MIRYTFPKFIKCTIPKKAISIADKSYKLPLDIKKCLHHTYIDSHGKPPKVGTNPIFDEYEQLFDTSDELRFIDPGIADDTESKIRESGKLGRGIARYILSEYYDLIWFAKIQNLLLEPYKGWTVERPKKGGNTPDWFISNGKRTFCLGEAKGTHSKIDLDSDQVKKWRSQCTNLVVKKNKIKKKLKSWLIATRFVDEYNKDKPEQLIEDPILQGEEINENDFASLNQYIIKNHLSESLFRLSNFQLGLKIGNENLYSENQNIRTWRPILNEIKHLLFIGKPFGHVNLPFSYWHWKEFLEYSTEPDFWEGFQESYELSLGYTYFDGISVGVLENFLTKKSYSPLEINEINLEKYPFVSLLSDGNLIIPMSLMRPDKLIKL